MNQLYLFSMAQWNAASGSPGLVKQLMAGAPYQRAHRQTFSRWRKALTKSKASKQTQDCK